MKMAQLDQQAMPGMILQQQRMQKSWNGSENLSPKPRSSTIVFGLDTPDDYGPHRVLDALGVPLLEAADPPVIETAQVLFLPSFHAECSLTVAVSENTPQITLVTMQTSLWYWWCHQMQAARGNLAEADEPPRSPELWQETADIAASRLEQFRGELDATNPLAPSDTKSASIDGMSVQGQYRSTDGKIATFHHHVHPDFPQHRAFILTLYRLATDLLHDERSIRVLESIHGHLGLGLPLKIAPGPPFTVRIFGGLTSSNEQELRASLERIPSRVPALMDLSNFDGMGMLLYPAFQRFIQREGRTVWWVPGLAKRQVEEMQVPMSSVYSTREAAMAALEL